MVVQHCLLLIALLYILNSGFEQLGCCLNFVTSQLWKEVHYYLLTFRSMLKASTNRLLTVVISLQLRRLRGVR